MTVADQAHDAAVGRLTPLSYSELDPAQKAMWDALRSGPRGAKAVRPEGYLTGPFDALLRAPAVGDQLAGLGALLRFESTLTARQRELVIVIVAAHWHARFAWNSHVVYAREAGVPEAALAALAAGARPVLDDPDDQLVADHVGEMVRTGVVDAETYEGVRHLLGDQGLVELVVLAGYYSLEAFVLNTFDVPLPPGAVDPWTPPADDKKR